MGYYEIENLYKDQTILNMKEVYVMEKIHGTSAHVSYKSGRLGFFAGGGAHKPFLEHFDQEDLLKGFEAMEVGDTSVIIYGENYGGKIQGMSATYGKYQSFVAFDVKIGDCWLNVPKAENIVISLGLEFVHYVKVKTTLDALNAERDAISIQGIRNDMPEMPREGIVIRPLEEMTLNNGKRLIAKHKSEKFSEVSSPRNVMDLIKLKLIKDGQEIADEWVTHERLKHVLDGLRVKGISIEMSNTGVVVQDMIQDVLKESADEIEMSQQAKKSIGKNTAIMFKQFVTTITEEK